jgi:outer membrane lipoprotein-sorting protein
MLFEKKIFFHKTIQLVSLSLLVFIFASTAYSNRNANEIMDKVRYQYSLVKDFEAEASLKIDISYLKVPNGTGKIFYKYPDKTAFEMKGLNMLPQKGLNSPVAQILTEKNTTPIYGGQAKYNGVTVELIKMIPLEQNSDIALATLWVDERTNTIAKMETTTKKSGTFTAEIQYLTVDKKYFVPKQVFVSFEVPEFKLPKTMTGDFDAKTEDKKPSANGKTKGTVTLTYWNYKVNKGINDSVFKKK